MSSMTFSLVIQQERQLTAPTSLANNMEQQYFIMQVQPFTQKFQITAIQNSSKGFSNNNQNSYAKGRGKGSYMGGHGPN
ncbi:hypothetical protein CR513_26450, partial [Mucuna pruriens]